MDNLKTNLKYYIKAENLGAYYEFTCPAMAFLYAKDQGLKKFSLLCDIQLSPGSCSRFSLFECFYFCCITPYSFASMQNRLIDRITKYYKFVHVPLQKAAR